MSQRDSVLRYVAFERPRCLMISGILDVGLGETDIFRSSALRDMDTQGPQARPVAGAGFL